MSIGNLATGNFSDVKLQEEYSFGVVGTSNAFFLRRANHRFQRIPTFVESNHAGSSDMGIVKKAFEVADGAIDFEFDMESFGWLAKNIMGNHVAAQQGGTSEYKHTFKFGTADLNTFQVDEDKGNLSTPYYRKYQGLFENILTLAGNPYGTVQGSIGYIGKTSGSGSDPGTPSIAAENLTCAFRDITFYSGTAGETAATSGGTWASWTDPYDFRFAIARPDAKADNVVADGTGQTTGIFEGTPTASLNLVAQFTTNHKFAVFEADTEIAFAVKLDTGVAIPSGNGSNYMLELIFPRVVLASYLFDVNGSGVVVPTIDVRIMQDPTAAYSTRLDLYNVTTDYADATA